VLFIWLSRQDPEEQMRVYAEYGFVPKRISQLSDEKIKVEVDVAPPAIGEDVDEAKQKLVLAPDRGAILLSLITCMFLHNGWLHLIGNVWFLWVFGNNIEDRLGPFIYLFLYLAVGWLATACQWAVTPDGEIPIVGASGAVAGILGAYAVTFPKAKVKTLVFLVVFFTIIEIPALVILLIWFGYQIWQGINGLEGEVVAVAWWAHIGGFLAGVIMMPVMAAGAPEPGTHWEDESEQEFEVL
jgi:membrane associated rhomboid family serine protease